MHARFTRAAQTMLHGGMHGTPTLLRIHTVGTVHGGPMDMHTMVMVGGVAHGSPTRNRIHTMVMVDGGNPATKTPITSGLPPDRIQKVRPHAFCLQMLPDR